MTDPLIERVARAICEACVAPKMCACHGREFDCADTAPGISAQAALAALKVGDEPYPGVVLCGFDEATVDLFKRQAAETMRERCAELVRSIRKAFHEKEKTSRLDEEMAEVMNTILAELELGILRLEVDDG